MRFVFSRKVSNDTHEISPTWLSDHNLNKDDIDLQCVNAHKVFTLGEELQTSKGC